MQTPGSSHKRCTGDVLARRAEAAAYQPGSGSLSGGLVLLGHTRGDTSPVADRDALVLRPGPDVRTALTAGSGPPGSAPLPRPALRACSMKGASCRRNALAFFCSGRSHTPWHRARTAPSHPLSLRPQRVDGVPTVGLPRGPARRAGGEAAGLQDV